MSKKIMLSTVFGLIGFAFTFLTNYGHNLVGTSLIRGIYGFIIWFVLAIVLMRVLGVIIGKYSESTELEAGNEDAGGTLGAKLDYQTPDEDQELKDLLTPKPAAADVNTEGFTPMQPPKLVTMKDPEELAKAVRHLKED